MRTKGHVSDYSPAKKSDVPVKEPMEEDLDSYQQEILSRIEKVDEEEDFVIKKKNEGEQATEPEETEETDSETTDENASYSITDTTISKTNDKQPVKEEISKKSEEEKPKKNKKEKKYYSKEEITKLLENLTGEIERKLKDINGFTKKIYFTN